MEGHVPNHLADRHAAGVLPPEQLAAVNAHAAGCEACAAKLAAAAKEREAFLARNPPALRAEALLEQARPRRRVAVWLVPSLALAASAIVAVVALPMSGSGLVEKGGPAVSTWARRPSTGRTWAPAPGEVLAAGDQLQLQVSPGGHARVTVYALDAAGTFTKVFSQTVKGTTTLEHSLTLDESPGPDTLFVLFSDVELPELQRAQVEGAGETMQVGGSAVGVRRWVVNKR